jgi:Tfp pilus assembly protein PilF
MFRDFSRSFRTITGSRLKRAGPRSQGAGLKMHFRLSTHIVLAIALGLSAGCQYASHGQNAEGVRLYQQAYYEGAMQRFQQAVQSDPQNPDGYYNLAATYHQLGKLHHKPNDLTQAESYYHQCLDRNPNHTDCYRALAVLLVDQNRSKDAFRLLEGWSERSPSIAAPKVELARLFEEQGNKDAAKQNLIDAIAIDPNNAKALAALGKIREDSGDPQQALANYQRSLAINRFQPQVAARVASLQGISTAAPVATPPGGTRTVAAPAQGRYY